MISPKLGPGAPAWYRYYAGYSEGFVESALAEPVLVESKVVLDPWNGSGTTTAVGARLGFQTVGLDVNPATVVIAKGRLLPVDTGTSVVSVAKEVVHRARDMSLPRLGHEPLERWFVRSAAERIRSVEWAIQHILVDHDQYSRRVSSAALETMSPLASFYYVALFAVVRDMTAAFRAQNPAWIRQATDPGMRVRLGWQDLERRFVSAAGELAGRLRHDVAPDRPPTLTLGAAESTGLPDQSVDAVITSPPYLTRLDYVMASLPELAVLGLTGPELKSLRSAMLGTPTVEPGDLECPQSAKTVLKQISRHESKASSSYYRRYFLQYFAKLESSTRELSRVVRPGGGMVVVVQDSYYKNIHVDLPQIFTDMALGCGWRLVRREDYSALTIGVVNPRSRKYGNSGRATESALVLQRLLAH